jgi:hypothetical protein
VYQSHLESEVLLSGTADGHLQIHNAQGQLLYKQRLYGTAVMDIIVRPHCSGGWWVGVTRGVDTLLLVKEYQVCSSNSWKKWFWGGGETPVCVWGGEGAESAQRFGAPCQHAAGLHCLVHMRMQCDVLDSAQTCLCAHHEQMGVFASLAAVDCIELAAGPRTQLLACAQSTGAVL